MSVPDREPARRVGAVLLILALPSLVGGCDGSGSVDVVSDAAVSGSLQEAPGAEGAPSGSSATGSAESVAVGSIRSDGTLDVMAQGEIGANGSFRIEGIQAGRADLVVQARNEAGVAVGEVLVLETTRSGAETRVHPITARTTTQARVETRLRASGRSDDAIRADLVLLGSLEGNAGGAATSTDRLDAMADAMAEARAAFAAHLEAGGSAPATTARRDAAAEALAEFQSSIRAGTSITAAHRAYARTVVRAWAESGAAGESLVTGTAAASQRLSTVLQARVSDDATAFAAMRASLRANLEARRALAEAQAEGNLGLRAGVIAHLDAIEARIAGATTVGELRSGIQAERASAQGRVSIAVLAALGGLDAQTLVVIDAHVRAAATAAEFWQHLDGSASTGATLVARTEYRAALRTAVDAWIASLPAASAAQVDADAAFRLFLALGGGASIA